MIFCSNSAHFPEIQLVCDRPTDGRTDGWTDTPSYRDARTHLNSCYRVINCNCNKRALYCRATIGFKEVRNQFPISNIVTVLPCISLINPMDDLICLVKVVLNREKIQQSRILGIECA